MTTDAIREWIDKREDLDQAATEGPWHATFGPRELARVWTDSPDDAEALAMLTGFTRQADGAPDAEFIADARTSLPAALAALKAVLGATEGKTGHYGHTPIDGDDCAACLAADVRDAVEAALRGES